MVLEEEKKQVQGKITKTIVYKKPLKIEKIK